MIRVAILGAGIGAQHLTAYKALPDLFEVVAICDLDIARAKAMAGDVAVTSDADALIDGDTVDLIDICLPPHLHVPMAKRVLEAGKHAICEKPIANSLADVDLLEHAQVSRGKLVFSVFQYRYGPAMSQLQALMNAGLIGKVFTATFETHWCRKADYYDNPWRGTWAGEQGGALLGHAIHAHDLLTFLLGPIKNVHARTGTRVNEIETEDCATLSLEMESGALVSSSVTLGGATDISRIKLVSEHMTATSGSTPYAPMSGGWVFEARDPSRQSEIDAVVKQAEISPVGFIGYLRDVARALEGEANSVVTLQDGRMSVELVTAAYHSARSGDSVGLPLQNDHPLYSGWLPD
jgi:predicted dehydrogenase